MLKSLVEKFNTFSSDLAPDDSFAISTPTDEPTRISVRAIITLLSHGLRASELSVLNVNNWNGKRLIVHRSKRQKVSEIPLSKGAQQHLETYLEWRQQKGDVFTPTPDSPMFLCQDPKHQGERLGYKGLYGMVKKLGAITSVDVGKEKPQIKFWGFVHQYSEGNIRTFDTT